MVRKTKTQPHVSPTNLGPLVNETGTTDAQVNHTTRDLGPFPSMTTNNSSVYSESDVACENDDRWETETVKADSSFSPTSTTAAALRGLTAPNIRTHSHSPYGEETAFNAFGPSAGIDLFSDVETEAASVRSTPPLEPEVRVADDAPQDDSDSWDQETITTESDHGSSCSYGTINLENVPDMAAKLEHKPRFSNIDFIDKDNLVIPEFNLIVQRQYAETRGLFDTGFVAREDTPFVWEDAPTPTPVDWDIDAEYNRDMGSPEPHTSVPTSSMPTGVNSNKAKVVSKKKRSGKSYTPYPGAAERKWTRSLTKNAGMDSHHQIP